MYAYDSFNAKHLAIHWNLLSKCSDTRHCTNFIFLKKSPLTSSDLIQQTSCLLCQSFSHHPKNSLHRRLGKRLHLSPIMDPLASVSHAICFLDWLILELSFWRVGTNPPIPFCRVTGLRCLWVLLRLVFLGLSSCTGQTAQRKFFQSPAWKKKPSHQDNSWLSGRSSHGLSYLAVSKHMVVSHCFWQHTQSFYSILCSPSIDRALHHHLPLLGWKGDLEIRLPKQLSANPPYFVPLIPFQRYLVLLGPGLWEFYSRQF